MAHLLTFLRRSLLFLLAFGVALYACIYFSFRTDFPVISAKTPAVFTQPAWQFAFYGHIFGGILALTTGPFQFLRRLRKRNLRLHRQLGMVYVGAILLAAPCALYAALYANEGWIARIGFAGLAIAWFITTLRAYTTIRAKNVLAHKRWMVRSYACTAAAITLRLWLPLEMAGFHLSFATAYQTVAWLCWVPNLLFAEWLIARRKFEL
ncbi:DUF2306 domain-containing protein [Arsenicibacter rosenii]|uniref:DUF2306 domain-containing protein n=1 Tax=Arsenicibacter rosenii TaxID=1750698 RepID=A0A1S2VFM8_9BACT|nr:DUF2306 domain-containing protein [Arsenicibacter rosenii]OIN57533.1 hypothetical protein BLX24_18760 [Arsenicibacter rosenii]